jgi:polyisoprenoid-binding protein YceI
MQWTIDPTHSQAEFSIRHMFTTVHGHIVVAGGTVQTDEEDLAKSAIWATLDLSSINTGVRLRDDHLRSADFFDVQRHPEIRFRSSEVRRTADNEFMVTGLLAIHGVTKPITLDARVLGDAIDHRGHRRAGFSARTTLDRKDFGLHWNQTLEAGGFLVGDMVEINLEIETVLEIETAVPEDADRAA